MKRIRTIDYLSKVREVLSKTEYICSDYEPSLRWVNYKIGMPESCWDYFHEINIAFITSTREWKDMWK